MRRFALVLCAVALTSCTDSGNTSPHTTSLNAAETRRRPTKPRIDTVTAAALDSISIPDRLSSLIGARFGKVALPPDAFSKSSDAVHPDIACLDKAWNGARCWMMYTPYKNGDSGYENPSFLAAVGDTNWSTPTAITNPIVAWPGFGVYNSDPDHAFEPGSNRLMQVYRVVTDSFNKIMIMSTTDARTWTPPRLAFKERNHDAISPSLVIDRDHSADLWYIRSGANGCSASSSTVMMRSATPDSTQRTDQGDWSAPVTVKMSVPNSVIWHIDVERVSMAEGYVALIVAYQKGLTCGASDLWLGTSPDGVNWRTFETPLMWRGMTVARQRSISTWYRGTMRYDATTDSLHVWPSGLAGANWTIYHTAFKLHDALGLLAAAQTSDLKLLASRQAGIRATIPMP